MKRTNIKTATQRITGFKTVPVFITLLLCFTSIAQDTLFFDENWVIVRKEEAVFYRPTPIKMKTIEALGSLSDYIEDDSIYQIKDYYIHTDRLQFQGYSLSKDPNAEFVYSFLGPLIWYDSIGNIIQNHYNDPYAFYVWKKNLKKNNRKYTYLMARKTMALNGGYYYLGRAKNSGYIGLDTRISSDNHSAFNIGIGTYVAEIENKISLLPAIQTNYSINKTWLIELSSSNVFFKPTVGINLINALQLKMGYNFWYSNKRYNGITFGVNVCFSKSNYNNGFYDQWFKLF